MTLVTVPVIRLGDTRSNLDPTMPTPWTVDSTVPAALVFSTMVTVEPGVVVVPTKLMVSRGLPTETAPVTRSETAEEAWLSGSQTSPRPSVSTSCWSGL